MRISRLWASAACMSLLGAVALSQVRVNTQVGRPENFNRVSPTKVGLNRMDKTYMKRQALTNIFEVRLGMLAARRSDDAWVRSFADDMIREHTLGQEELKQLARRKGYRLPTMLPRTERNKLAKMERLRGAAFDREFRRIQMAGHEVAMKLQTREIKSGRDAMVRSLATKSLATTRGHHLLAMHRDSMLVRAHDTSGTAAQPIKR